MTTTKHSYLVRLALLIAAGAVTQNGFAMDASDYNRQSTQLARMIEGRLSEESKYGSAIQVSNAHVDELPGNIFSGLWELGTRLASEALATGNKDMPLSFEVHVQRTAGHEAAVFYVSCTLRDNNQGRFTIQDCVWRNSGQYRYGPDSLPRLTSELGWKEVDVYQQRGVNPDHERLARNLGFADFSAVYGANGKSEIAAAEAKRQSWPNWGGITSPVLESGGRVYTNRGHETARNEATGSEERHRGYVISEPAQAGSASER